MERWVNVQLNGGFPVGDTITGFNGALAILDWEVPCQEPLSRLNAPVKLWRWTQDPRQWEGWPDKYIERCPYAMFANEPDIEGWPSWYLYCLAEWGGSAGGKVVEPAFSDEKKYENPYSFRYDVVTWHDYRGEFFNRPLVLKRANDRPVWGTEYGTTNNQAQSRYDLLTIPEPVAIFAWRWVGNTNMGYDVAGKGLDFMTYPDAKWVPSPNFWQGRNGQTVRGVVYHGTAGPNAVSWFQSTQSQVSAHFVVSKDGAITQCVNEDDSAWHAGVVTPNSIYAGQSNPNYWTIGIEHERDTTNTSPLTDAQIQSSINLTKYLRTKYPKAVPILHDAIDVGRVCPGPNFPLDQIWNGGNVPVDNSVQLKPEPVTTPEQIHNTNDQQMAKGYYFQRGHKVDTTHALWTNLLYPMWQLVQQMRKEGNPLADAVNIGPLVGDETGTTWGDNEPAAVVKTTNGIYGVHGPKWLPYRQEVWS